jgi:hypothetical protein
MSSKNFTGDDIANLLLSEENNSENELWSDDKRRKDEDKEIVEFKHEDDSDYEGEQEEGEVDSNSNDDSDIYSCGGNGIIIRGRNGYDWSVIEPKRMGQLPRRNIVVIKPGNRVKLKTVRHQFKHGIYYLHTVFCRNFCFTNSYM